GGFTAADPTAATHMYGEVQRMNIFRSTNAGVSASYIFQGITDASSLNVNFIPFFMLDPNNASVMLAGGRRLWRTTNVKAATVAWTAIKATIEPPGRPGGEEPPNSHYSENSPYNISTLAVAQGSSDLIWVGYNNGQVWKTTNGTAAVPAWTRVDQSGPIPGRWVSKILVDPASSQRVYVTLLGYVSGNVWKTENAGTNWANISGSGATALPAVPVTSLARHPQAPGRLYAGTDIGLFLSSDDGQAWAPIDATGGPGLAPVEQLFFKDAATLVVVTHGRGVYYGTFALPSCYANCDESTQLPVLNVQDFSCFLGRYSAGEAYANCDESTTAPVLNVQDFGCFLTRYAAGCP
ncbi:MAG: hypothetical protein WD749_14820, partial [Phycisphaerales bacterium]